VDPGRLLFGIKQPTDAPCPPGSIRSALRGFRTRLIQVKAVTAGDPSDYRGMSSVAKYGVVPFGWADGFLPDAYQKSGALVRGVRVPFLKGLSTEHSVIDLTAVPDARAGDTVTLLGSDGEASIDVEQFAKDAGILVSEVTRRFHRHLPYVYFANGVPTHVKTLAGEIDGPF
jgi:alanine racemase